MDEQLIFKYFQQLTDKQKSQFSQLSALYSEWNAQINVISRKDMDQFYERHVLHSLALAKYFPFAPGMKVLDVGTGGGFPGIPLAILFPDTQFLLVDSIGKKIKVVNAVIDALGLQNTTAKQLRAEQLTGHFDVVVSRAVTDLETFTSWVSNKLRGKRKSAEAGGILYLKGGDLKEEIAAIKKRWEYNIQPISQWFEEDFFETKQIVHVF